MARYSPEIQEQLRRLGLGKSKTEQPSEHADREHSLTTLSALLSPYRYPDWIVDLQQLDNKGQHKRYGFSPDFVVRFADGFPVPFVNIQAIHDESFMACYDGHPQVHGLTASQVRDQKLVYLNGCWSEATIIADLLEQTMSLQQIWGNDAEKSAFLGRVPPEIANMYQAGFWPVEQYRARYLEWMNQESPRVFYVDGLGVRRTRTTR